MQRNPSLIQHVRQLVVFVGQATRIPRWPTGEEVIETLAIPMSAHDDAHEGGFPGGSQKARTLIDHR